MEKDYNEFFLLSNKLSVKTVLIERAVKTTIKLLFDKELFDKYYNKAELSKDSLLID